MNTRWPSRTAVHNRGPSNILNNGNTDSLTELQQHGTTLKVTGTKYLNNYTNQTQYGDNIKFLNKVTNFNCWMYQVIYQNWNEMTYLTCLTNAMIYGTYQPWTSETIFSGAYATLMRLLSPSKIKISSLFTATSSTPRRSATVATTEIVAGFRMYTISLL